MVSEHDDTCRKQIDFYMIIFYYKNHLVYWLVIVLLLRIYYGTYNLG